MSDKVNQKIQQVKQAGLPVFAVKINNQKFVYRGTNRKEFRDLQGQMAKLAEDLRTKHKDDDNKLTAELALLKEKGEEKLFLRCVIEPEIENDLDIDVVPAGVVTKIADLIMKASGFDDNEPEIEQL